MFKHITAGLKKKYGIFILQIINKNRFCSILNKLDGSLEPVETIWY